MKLFEKQKGGKEKEGTFLGREGRMGTRKSIEVPGTNFSPFREECKEHLIS